MRGFYGLYELKRLFCPGHVMDPNDLDPLQRRGCYNGLCADLAGFIPVAKYFSNEGLPRRAYQDRQSKGMKR